MKTFYEYRLLLDCDLSEAEVSKTLDAVRLNRNVLRVEEVRPNDETWDGFGDDSITWDIEESTVRSLRKAIWSLPDDTPVRLSFYREKDDLIVRGRMTSSCIEYEERKHVTEADVRKPDVPKELELSSAYYLGDGEAG